MQYILCKSHTDREGDREEYVYDKKLSSSSECRKCESLVYVTFKRRRQGISWNSASKVCFVSFFIQKRFMNHFVTVMIFC